MGYGYTTGLHQNHWYGWVNIDNVGSHYWYGCAVGYNLGYRGGILIFKKKIKKKIKKKKKIILGHTRSIGS